MDETEKKVQFIHFKYDFARVVGNDIFKKESKDWNNDPAKDYINGLLKNLNECTSFDVNSTENQILKSFSAFCKKGEDVDKLEEYLISNDIFDFRIAFGLWGIIFGFADMPKTLTNEFLLSDDKDYISTMYEHIHKQLHDVNHLLIT